MDEFPTPPKTKQIRKTHYQDSGHTITKQIPLIVPKVTYLNKKRNLYNYDETSEEHKKSSKVEDEEVREIGVALERSIAGDDEAEGEGLSVADAE